MITVDVVMPFGGYRGGIENIMYEWSRGLPDDEINLRFFHASPGIVDYLKGYKNQWTMPIPENRPQNLTAEYIAGAYAFFIDKEGPPEICIATWLPIVSRACVMVRNAKTLSFPVLSYMHSKIGLYAERGQGSLADISFADAHICISKEIESDIKSYNPEALTFLLGNPLKVPTVSKLCPDDRTLCFVGRLGVEKKVDTIIKAISLAKDKTWKLLIVGDGEDKERLISLTYDLGLENRVTFFGWQEEPWECVKKSRFCMLASEYEGCNGTTREASALGMTVISTPVGGVVDYIVPGENGYLFPIGDSSFLAMVLDGLSDEKLPICDEKKCRDSVEKYYVDNYFLNVKNIFKSIV